MADNVAITAGTGTNIATDEVGGVHYQQVKIVDGTLDASGGVAIGGGTEDGALRVTIANNSTGVVTVDGTVTAELSATDNAVLDTIDSALDVIAAAVATEGDALGDGVLIQGDDGTDRTNILVDAAGHLQVDIATIPSTAVTNADITTVAGAVSGGHMQVDVIAAPAIVLGAGTAEAGYVVAHGLTAHDGAITEATAGHQPVRIGAKSLNGPAAVTDISADADAVSLLATRGGILYVNTSHPNFWTATISDHNTAQTAHEIVAAPAAGLALYVTDVIISNGATAGTVSVHSADSHQIICGPLYFAINGGAVINFRTPIRCETAHALQFTSVTVTTHTVTVCGYTAA